jgi:hypothetical protein
MGTKKPPRIDYSIQRRQSVNRYLVAITRTTRITGVRELATGTARFHRLGFVHGQITSAVILAMQSVDGALAFFGAAHGDEPETAGAAGFTIHDHVGFGNGTVLSEKLVQILLGGLEGKIPYV